MNQQIVLKECKSRAELKKFSRFAIDLYRGNDCYVPPIVSSEVDLFDPEVNPSLEFCEKINLLAFRDGKPVGRIAGIFNPRVNEKTGEKRVRFGYCDFVDDQEVSHALLDAVAQWGRERGMAEMVGPMGFTDLDMEGCLIDGFDQICTAIAIYNYPYYKVHFEAYGLQPDAYWNEYRMEMIDGIPERYSRIGEIVKQKLGLKVIKVTDAKEAVEHWGKPMFDLYDQCYAPLYGTAPLTQKQKDYYIGYFLPQVRLDHVRFIVDADGKLAAFGVANPSLSKALQKANGSLWPFGWLPLLKTLKCGKQTDTCELYLIGIRPDLQGKGVNALLFTELIPEFIKNGYKYVETTNELETNMKVQNMWVGFDPKRVKRRCTFVGKI